MPRVTLTNIKSNFRFQPFSIPFLLFDSIWTKLIFIHH
ncbi:unnamed protein product [Tenebrio molitor]|nr:unnamed protein product [Tenebrio molitor]